MNVRRFVFVFVACGVSLEKMRWRRRARVVLPLLEGPEMAIMVVFCLSGGGGILGCGRWGIGKGSNG